MNKKFFEGMKSFAKVFLVLGLIGASVLLFTIVIVPGVNKYGSSTMDFSASGLVITLAAVLGVVGGYYLFSSVARMGINSFAERSFTLEPGQYLSGRDFELGSYIAYASAGTLILETKDGQTIGKYQLNSFGLRCFFNEDTVVVLDQKTKFVP